jgi:hypothetical protein
MLPLHVHVHVNTPSSSYTIKWYCGVQTVIHWEDWPSFRFDLSFGSNLQQWKLSNWHHKIKPLINTKLRHFKAVTHKGNILQSKQQPVIDSYFLQISTQYAQREPPPPLRWKAEQTRSIAAKIPLTPYLIAILYYTISRLRTFLCFFFKHVGEVCKHKVCVMDMTSCF